MSIMCDWLSFIVEYDGPDFCGGRTLTISEDGELQYEKMNFKPVEGSFSSKVHIKTVPYRSIGRGLYISGNATKFFQGHNLFGLFQVQGLAYDLCVSVLNKIGYVDLALLEKVKHGHFDLTRIDITASYRLPSTNDVRSWLKHATTFASGKFQNATDYRGKTLYFGQDSRYCTFKFYSKFDDKYFQKDIQLLPEKQTLFLNKFSEGILRAEYTIRSMKLKKMGLKRGFQWDEKLARGLFNMQLKKINLTGEYELESEVVQALEPCYRAAYELYKRGLILKDLYKKTTYYKYRKYFLNELNINVDVPRNPERGQVIPLIKVLQAEPLEIPQEAFDLDLVYRTSNR